MAVVWGIVLGFVGCSLLYWKLLSTMAEQLEESKGSLSSLSIVGHLPGFRRLYRSLEAFQKERASLLYDLRTSERRRKEGLAALSHDLRTPLTVLIGYLRLAIEKKEEENTYLAVAEQKAARLHERIEAFYALSQAEMAEVHLSFERLESERILEEALLSIYESHRKVALTIEKAPFVIADEKALLRVYENLLRNAIQHGDGALKVHHYVKENKVCTAISNRVIGIKPDLTKLGEAFYRADASRGGNAGGLGLATAKALIEHMHGKLSFRLDDDRLTVIAALPCEVKEPF